MKYFWGLFSWEVGSVFAMGRLLMVWVVLFTFWGGTTRVSLVQCRAGFDLMTVWSNFGGLTICFEFDSCSYFQQLALLASQSLPATHSATSAALQSA